MYVDGITQNPASQIYPMQGSVSKSAGTPIIHFTLWQSFSVLTENDAAANNLI